MRDYQRDFLDFALQHGVLRFGEFTLKSGRVSPYFFNAGLFNRGAALARLEATVVIRQLLERTKRIDAAHAGRWLPSLLVRRLE